MIRRRRFLVTASSVAVAASAIALTGCEPDGTRGPDRAGGGEPSPVPDPDLPLLTTLVSSEKALILLYESTKRKHPKLQAVLQPYEKRHRQHLDALEKARRTATKDQTSPATATGSASGSAPKVPASRPDALSALAKAEQDAFGARMKDLTTAENGELARLIASIAACETVHADALGEQD